MAETQQPDIKDDAIITFGMRLKSTRESRGLAKQEVAAQLRLSEKVIIMLENEVYPDELPPTFIRGYIRAYGKLLDIPEDEIKLALEPVQPKETLPIPDEAKIHPPAHRLRYVMQIITAIIALIIIGLIGMWWHVHNDTRSHATMVAENFTENKPISNSSNNDIANIVDQEANEKNILNSTESAALSQTLKKAPHGRIHQASPTPKKSKLTSLIVGIHHYVMQLVTHLLIFLTIGLMSLCWYHYRIIAKSQQSSIETDSTTEPFTENDNKLDSSMDTVISIKKIRLYLALVLFVLVSLFCVWWYNLLTSLTSTLMPQSTATKYSSLAAAKSSSGVPKEVILPDEIDSKLADEQIQSEPQANPSVNPTQVNSKDDAELNVNEMKKIAPTLAKKYTPIPKAADESDSPADPNPATVNTAEHGARLAAETKSDD